MKPGCGRSRTCNCIAAVGRNVHSTALLSAHSLHPLFTSTQKLEKSVFFVKKTKSDHTTRLHQQDQHTSILSPTQLLQRPSTLLEPLLSRYPKVVAVLHDIRENSSTEEHHVFSTRRILDPDFEFLMCTVGRLSTGGWNEGTYVQP